MDHCVVCHGDIGDRGAWKVPGPGPERLAHFDCYRLAFDREPAQRCCEVCGRSVWGAAVTLPIVTIRGIRLHTSCAIYTAPSFKAAWGRN